MSPQFVDRSRERVRHWIWLLAVGWLGISLALLAWDLWSDEFDMTWVSRIYFSATLLCSLVLFLLYGWDKRQSQKEGRRRISEAALHRLAIFGGWPGGVLGQQVFRHKTEKVSFRLKAGVILFVHFLILLYALRNILLSWLP
jgi:uncharacterized membrane protein YsdA (DUF1294 family)